MGELGGSDCAVYKGGGRGLRRGRCRPSGVSVVWGGMPRIYNSTEQTHGLNFEISGMKPRTTFATEKTTELLFHSGQNPRTAFTTNRVAYPLLVVTRLPAQS